MHLQSFLKKLFTAFASVFFPPVCSGCKSNLSGFEKFLCSECLNNLPVFEPVLGHPIHGQVLGGRMPLEHLGCFLRFTKGSRVQNIMHGMKYENRRELALFLGELFGQRLKQEGFVCDILIPVPVHRKKLKDRGYNQAALIAYGIGTVLGIPVSEGNLIKNRYTQTQTKLNREQRMLNLKGSFELKNYENFKGKHVALVDDVLTTGSTTENIWEIMREVPQLKISALYLCHARD
ncbi:MAG: ComF family protein [Bacteroidia bacterium]|nr:ComF family protein [Bacteroidia bacterium]